MSVPDDVRREAEKTGEESVQRKRQKRLGYRPWTLQSRDEKQAFLRLRREDDAVAADDAGASVLDADAVGVGGEGHRRLVVEAAPAHLDDSLAVGAGDDEVEFVAPWFALAATLIA